MNSSSKILALGIATVLIAGMLATSNVYAYLLDVQVSSGTTDDGRKTVTLFFAEPPNGETAVDTDDIVDAVVDEAGQTDGVDDVNVTGAPSTDEPIVITNDQTNDTTVIVPVVEDNVTVVATNETTGEVTVVSNETDDGGAGVIDVAVNGTEGGSGDNATAPVVDVISGGDNNGTSTDDGGNATVVENGGEIAPQVNGTTTTEETQVNGTGIECIAFPCETPIDNGATNATDIGAGDNSTGIVDNSTVSNGTSTGEIPVIVDSSGDNGTTVEVGEVAENDTGSSLSCVTGTFDLQDGPTGVVQCLAIPE